jgi:hypothetical protein
MALRGPARRSSPPDEGVADAASPFFRERTAWLLLFEAARISVETGAAVVFQ